MSFHANFIGEGSLPVGVGCSAVTHASGAGLRRELSLAYLVVAASGAGVR